MSRRGSNAVLRCDVPRLTEGQPCPHTRKDDFGDLVDRRVEAFRMGVRDFVNESLLASKIFLREAE